MCSLDRLPRVCIQQKQIISFRKTTTIDGVKTTHRVPSLSSLLGIRGQFEFLHSSLPSFICFFAHLYPNTSVSQLFCSFNHLFIYPSVQSTGERLNRRTIQASFGSIVLLFNRSFIQSFFR